MKKIKYIAYFANPEKHKNRNIVLSAVNKINYICEAINKSGFSVEIVSGAGSSVREKGGIFEINDNTSVKLFMSLGKGSKIFRVLSRWSLNIECFLYLIKNTRKNETVVAYHSLGYMLLLRLLKRLKKIRLVLEVEEIYSDVIGDSKKKEKELKFFKLADAYIFPTELLDELINTENKPSVIIHGTYRVEEERENLGFCEENGGKVRHLVYAGTFDPRKGGAAAAAAAEKLPNCYHIHILGFGSDDDKGILEETIKNVNNSGGARVTMDGLLRGEDYIRFIQSCDVGFSTQMPDADFNNTSFPSKVLSYMANGLRVVSVKIPALERSEVNDLLCYYEGGSPEDIANAVLSIDFEKPYNSREVIRKLDEKFTKEIGELLNGR